MGVAGSSQPLPCVLCSAVTGPSQDPCSAQSCLHRSLCHELFITLRQGSENSLAALTPRVWHTHSSASVACVQSPLSLSGE